MDRIADITDRFFLLEDHLVYVDEPLEGVARDKDAGDLFVFRALAIIPGLLWHWVLIPVSSADVIAAVIAIERSLQALVERGAIRGIFETVLQIRGSIVTVRGAVIDGIARVGTAFIPR